MGVVLVGTKGVLSVVTPFQERMFGPHTAFTRWSFSSCWTICRKTAVHTEVGVFRDLGTGILRSKFGEKSDRHQGGAVLAHPALCFSAIDPVRAGAFDRPGPGPRDEIAASARGAYAESTPVWLQYVAGVIEVQGQ
jgi:hypothetical protein